MPCYRCQTRQTDPARGASPWKRGVRGGEQVLVCPDCQRVHAWADDMDQCATCASTQLVRVLGETTCRSCGAVGDGVSRAASEAPPVAPGGLADEVAAALDKLRRPDPS